MTEVRNRRDVEQSEKISALHNYDLDNHSQLSYARVGERGFAYMILCHCVGVTDATVCQLIRGGASTPGEIARLCGAGRCCAACRDEIVALLGRASPSIGDGAMSGRQEGAEP
jgi:bacterioferritin-associated ferredoxin